MIQHIVRSLWVAAMISVSVVQAEVAFFEGFAVVRTVGEPMAFFDTDTPTSNPEFSGIIAWAGEDEYLQIGGEVKATRSNVDSSETFAGSVVFHYTINHGATNTLPLPRVQTSPDQFQVASATGMVNLASVLAVGSNTVRVWFTGSVLGNPVATPSIRMPATGAYEAVVVVVPKAPGLVAKDDAGHPAYARGLTNNANGGFGFGPWTNATQLISDGAAGFFVATNPPNTDLNHIASEGLAWAAYANEAGSGGNDIQIAGAYRPLNEPFAVGQTLSLDLEHGGIQSGNFSNPTNGPRTGGFVGVGLRASGPTQSYDPDPISPFGGLNDIVLFGFRGGDSEYVIMDVQQTSGRPTGLPFTTNGVRLNITRTETNLLNFVATSKGPGSTSVTFTAQIGGNQPLAWLAIYNRNAEENDVFFNNLLIEDAPSTNLVAYDDAADGAYASGWTNNANGGFGFTPWSLFSTNGNGGAGGHFLGTNPPNTDLQFIDTGRRAWGAFANDSGNPAAGVQLANALRGLPGGALQVGQTLGFSLEHGGIASVNGQVQIRLLGTPTFVNQEGIEFTWTFAGGGTAYSLADDRFGSRATGVPFTFDGLRFDFTLVDAQPFLYAVRVESFGTIAGTRYYYGPLASAPTFVDFRVRDVEENNVYINRLYVRGLSLDNDLDGMPNDWELDNELDPNVNDAWDDDDLDGFANLEEYIAGTDPQEPVSFFAASTINTGEGQPVAVSVPSVTGRVYALEYTTNLVDGMWTVAPGQSLVPGNGTVLILTNTPTDQAGLRLRVTLP
jgi:hypothetical protein